MAEINIIGDRLNIYGKEVTDDMYSAIDIALDKLEKQIKKNKGKIRKYRIGSKSNTKENIVEDTPSMEDEATPHVIVKNIEYKPMDVEEAIMQMGLVNDNFLVFTDARSNRINVLYRRKDGNYGLIQPRS
jgi:putative sigma-54 modulation protein